MFTLLDLRKAVLYLPSNCGDVTCLTPQTVDKRMQTVNSFILKPWLFFRLFYSFNEVCPTPLVKFGRKKIARSQIDGKLDQRLYGFICQHASQMNPYNHWSNFCSVRVEECPVKKSAIEGPHSLGFTHSSEVSISRSTQGHPKWKLQRSGRPRMKGQITIFAQSSSPGFVFVLEKVCFSFS